MEDKKGNSKKEKVNPIKLSIQELEERIAPSANLNPGENNTNLQGNQPGDGGDGGGNPGNNNPGENNTHNPGNETS